MAKRARVRVTRILLAVSDDVDRAVVESDLLRVGYRVNAVASVEEALTSAQLNDYDLLAVEVGLSGGGGFSLCRKLSGDEIRIPAVALSQRPVDLQVRQMGVDSGIEHFVEAPFHSGQVESAIELVLTRDRVRFSRDRGHSVRGGLGEWSVADLIRYMDFYGFTGDVALNRSEHHGTMNFRDGALTSAELGEIHGERAVMAMLDWNDGAFELTHEPCDRPEKAAVRPPRNVHRGVNDLLLAALGTRVDAHRKILHLPGLTDPHSFDLDKARRVSKNTDLLGRLHRTLDDSRSLREALQAAHVEGGEEMADVVKLVEAGAITPLTEPHPLSLGLDEAEPVPVPVEARTTQPQVPPIDKLEPVVEPETEEYPETAERDAVAAGAAVGRQTVSRKLGFKRKVETEKKEPDAFAELDSESMSRRRSRGMMRMTWLSIAAILAVIVIAWVALSEDTSKVPEVRVIDGSTETAP